MMNGPQLHGRTCCFTGRRPEKLGHEGKEIGALLEMVILRAINDEYISFISGMARGADIWAAEVVLRLCGAGRGTLLRMRGSRACR